MEEKAEDEAKKGDDKDERTKKPDEAKSGKDAERKKVQGGAHNGRPVKLAKLNRDAYVELQDQWNGPYFFLLKKYCSAPGERNCPNIEVPNVVGKIRKV